MTFTAAVNNGPAVKEGDGKVSGMVRLRWILDRLSDERASTTSKRTPVGEVQQWRHKRVGASLAISARTLTARGFTTA